MAISKLQYFVEEYVPDVETFFETKLAPVEIKHFNWHDYYNLMKEKNPDDPEALEKIIYEYDKLSSRSVTFILMEEKNRIFYNPKVDDTSTQINEYVAVYSLAKLCTKTVVGLDTYRRMTNDVKNSIAEYVAFHMVGVKYGWQDAFYQDVMPAVESFTRLLNEQEFPEFIRSIK